MPKDPNNPLGLPNGAPRPNPAPKRPDPFAGAGKNVALVQLEGSIMPGGAIEYFKSNLLLETAFQNPKIDSVMLYINSPGGSPTQSEMIAGRIRELSKKFNKPVVTVVGDMAASGGYWIAAAGDEIYVHKTSGAGSIGVVQNAQGVVDKMKKEGVEDRTLYSGKNKVTNSPYKPVDPKERANLLKKLQFLHHEFIDWVQERRGSKLKDSLIDKKNVLDSELFSGEMWFGKQAVEVGLADGIGSIHSVLEKKFGADAKLFGVGLVPGQGPVIFKMGASEDELKTKTANDSNAEFNEISKQPKVKAKAEKKRIRVKAGSKPRI
ncbi:MAG: S49 family peptidase [Rickettsiales bacterium]|nr:S49 family peptidase [Rickettsiales bacterium]|tara:strand:- start:239 stop:1201 length:963 start_codon:yes stop_codon:yes gene_type:complete